VWFTRSERRIENNMTGFKIATSVGGVSTGERGDRIILDDPHNVIKAESDLREKTVRFVRESMSNRLNDEQSAISSSCSRSMRVMSPVTSSPVRPTIANDGSHVLQSSPLPRQCR
jgi:hypothetical protein